MKFDDWWHETGSGIKPLEGDDMEEHAKRVAKASWFFAKIDMCETKPFIDEFNEAWMDSLS